MTTGHKETFKTNFMTIINKKINIEASLIDVWNIVSDLGGIQNYNPSVKKSFYTTDEKNGVGAARVCEFHPMGKVEETATQWEDKKSYTLHIKPIEKLPFFNEGFAHFSLIELGNSLTQVSVDFEYKVNSNPIALIMNKLMLKGNFDKAFEGILLGLKTHIEEGIVIDNFSILRQYHIHKAS